MIKLKTYLVLEIDEDDYPVPTDGQVGSEIEQALEEFLYDIDGVTIHSIKTITE